LFGEHGASFVRSILKQLKDGKETLKVVDDQVSCPTNVKHLSQAMVKLMEKNAIGVVNVSSEGYCSWHKFASKIVQDIGYSNRVEVLPVKTGEFPFKAVRPAWSVLSKEWYSKVTGDTMPTWQEGLSDFFVW
jgi:dTDP-4-dehydrorhamnose reductase